MSNSIIKLKKSNQQPTDGQTDQPANQWTDQPTSRACMRLKNRFCHVFLTKVNQAHLPCSVVLTVLPVSYPFSVSQSPPISLTSPPYLNLLPVPILPHLK